MKRILPALLAAGALLGGSPWQDGPEWLGDLDAATALARESERPLLLVFR